MKENGKELGIYEFETTGDMSVTEYEDQFSRLIKYMPIYNLDEEAKA